MMQFGLQEHVLKELKQIFENDARITNVWLYGSRAIGNHKPSSDIDLCVEGSGLELKDLYFLENKVDNLNLPWKVDLSLTYQIDNPVLLNHIQTVGISFLSNQR